MIARDRIILSRENAVSILDQNVGHRSGSKFNPERIQAVDELTVAQLAAQNMNSVASILDTHIVPGHLT